MLKISYYDYKNQLITLSTSNDQPYNHIILDLLLHVITSHRAGSSSASNTF